jgi:predicted RNase H-like nuclease (RuvC/YqgF family)
MMIEKGCGDTVDAIAQLATATTSDSETVEMLTATNAKLASQLEAAQSYIKMLNYEILAFKAKIKIAWQGQRRMIIRFTRTTRAPLAKREMTDTKRWRQRTTPWEASLGGKNDTEGQLRL